MRGYLLVRHPAIAPSEWQNACLNPAGRTLRVALVQEVRHRVLARCHMIHFYICAELFRPQGAVA